ncbi:MAG TPA: patatin-like phospholipase family protein [Bacilli bacterium]|nr:patatin-like phospholipase family protein [Bacilli bacterium]
MKIGVALSGGTLRGAAHIGVLMELQEAGIRPEMIAGTSAGSVVASMYAHGFHPKMIAKIATQSFEGRQLIDWTTSLWDLVRFFGHLPLIFTGLSKNFERLLPIGFIAGRKFEEFLGRTFKLSPTQKPIPLLLSAVDLYSGETVVFRDSRIADLHTGSYRSVGVKDPGTVILPLDDPITAVRCSCSMPGVFTPRKIDGRTLIDGAIRNNLPAELLYEAGCDKVIAVDLLNARMAPGTIRTFFDVFMRAWDIMMNEITVMQLENENVFVLQPTIEDVGWTAFDKLDYCIEQGRQVVRDNLQEIQDYIKKPTLR